MLHSMDVRKGDNVAIISHNRPEWAVGAFASMGLGAAFVPMVYAIA
jgi:long-chain acyl-CoA synthetase